MVLVYTFLKLYILDKTQLQRFLGSLNYIADFYQNLRQQCKLLFDRLRTNPSPWTPAHTTVVQHIKQYVKTLPCLGIPAYNDRLCLGDYS